jgi:hypothetical protein
MQVALSRRIAHAKQNIYEHVFCGELTDINGIVRLESNGTEEACLRDDAIHEMRWVLPEVQVRSVTVGCSCFSERISHSRKSSSFNSPLQLPPAGVLCESPGSTACITWVPPPSPATPFYERLPIIAGVMCAFVALTLFLALIASVSAVVFRRALNHSSPDFLLTLNFGATLYAGALLTYVIPERTKDLTSNICVTRMWLQGMGFAILFGSLFSKTQRVHALFNNDRITRLRLTSLYVMRLLAIIVVCEAAVLTVLTLVLPGRVIFTPISSGSFIFTRCAALDGRRPGPVMILASIQVAFLMWGAYLAFKTRRVSAGFNESMWIGFSIYNVIACELLGLILVSIEVSVCFCI